MHGVVHCVVANAYYEINRVHASIVEYVVEEHYAKRPDAPQI